MAGMAHVTELDSLGSLSEAPSPRVFISGAGYEAKAVNEGAICKCFINMY